jgi:hypothetical protein
MRRYRRCLGALAAVGLLAVPVVSPAPAAAEPVLDANCPGPPDPGVITTSARRAQTFTALTTGSLVRGELEIREGVSTTGDYIMQIVTADGSGVPTNDVLASTMIPDASVPAGDVRISVTFDPSAPVTAGQQYALVFGRSGSGWILHIRDGNPCPGQQFFSTTDSWSLAPGEFDAVFAVFVEPPPEPEPGPGPGPGPVAGRTLTLDANKNKVKEGKKVTLTGRVVETRQTGACAASQPVELQLKKPSQSTFTTVEQLTSDASGNFSAKEKVKKTFEYRAQAAATANCAAGLSNTEKVKVKKKK